MKASLVFFLLLFVTLPLISAETDHDSLTTVKLNVIYNNKRLDSHDTRMDKQDDRILANEQRMQSLENEFINIRGIGIGVLAVGGVQIILQLANLLVKSKQSQK